MKHLLIVDGHHLLYRAYWAIPRTMKTSKGEQVNTVFGVASMLLMMLKTEQPDSILFCFDADEDTFRHKEYAEYKAGRSATPDDFYPQVPRALQLVDSFGIPSVSGGGFEADDFACTYARRAEEKGMRVTIVTGDRDLFQLASDRIKIAIPAKGYQMPEYMGPEEIFKKYGVTPAQISAYKGLVGDSSDNLPGVKGIGPKAAEALIQKYGTIESIYDHLSDIKPAWRVRLEAGKKDAFFCARMALLKSDIELPVPLQDLEFDKIHTKPIMETLHDFEFTLVARRFESLLASKYGQEHFFRDHTELAALQSAKKIDAAVLETEPKKESQLTLL